jgi:hypothetical protein
MDLKHYRLPGGLVNFSKYYLVAFVGSLRSPNHTLVALPLRPGLSSPMSPEIRTEDGSLAAEEVVTTARSATIDSTPPGTRIDGSIMRQWVDELTGRAQNAEAGLRVPSEAEVAHVTNMFPSLDREVIVAALRRK